MDVHGIDLIVVDDRAEAGAGEGDFRVRIFALKQPGVAAGGEGVLAEIVQPQQRAEPDAAHTAL